MINLDWVFSSGFLGMRYYDLPNFLICVLFVLIAGRLLRVSAICQSVLLLHCFLPFVLNGVLFSYGYMPDALKYWRSFNAIREGGIAISDAWWLSSNVDKSAVLFNIIPLPFAITPISLGFHNTLMYIALFFWLYRKQVFTPVSLWFFLLYPSLALYTGMGLRDTFIFVFMVLAVQWAREGRWWFSMFPLYLLYSIKFQNFFILGPILFIYVVFGLRQKGMSISRTVAVVAVAMATLVLVAPIALPEVNKVRAALYVEDGGDIRDVEYIDSPREFVSEGLVSGLYFLVKPFPWEASNPLQLIQAGENLLVLSFLFLVGRVAWKQSPRKLMFWLLFFTVAMSVYGVVVFNYGTSARYRYAFVVIFVIFSCADCGVKKVLPFRFRSSVVPNGST